MPAHPTSPPMHAPRPLAGHDWARARRRARVAVVWGALALAATARAAETPNAPADAPPVAACSDFDAYVNGSWAQRTALPPDRARVGSFDQLRVANDRLLERALAELVAEPARQTSPGLKLLALHYAAGMDLEAIERRGLEALAPWLGRIATVTREGLPQLLADLARVRVAAPLALGVMPDLKDMTRHVLQIGQAGLGMPDRQDYLLREGESLRVQQAYRRFAQRLLEAAALPAGEAELDGLFAFEGELARATLTRVQRRDPNAVVHPQTLASLAQLAPGFDWTAYLARFAGRSAADIDAVPINLSQPAFAQAFARRVREAPIEQWRTYLRVRLLADLADALPRAFADASFDYRQRTLRGLERAPRRPMQLTQMFSNDLGAAALSQTLGELYVQKAFSATAQQRALVMVADIRAAMAERIRNLAWMSEPTKRFALAKLDAMVVQIGAPPQWRRYEGLQLAADDFAGNVLKLGEWTTREMLGDLGRPLDRTRWNTSPHIVNAFAAGGNRIVFPAGILQPPFFDERADDASNYGGIGMVIGHEITHHFDDRGRQFDAQGNLRDWWAPEDAVAYKQRAERLAAFFSQYEPVPGVRINGHQMLGENISDLGGLQIAFDGLQRALARQRAAGGAIPLIDGQTPEQRFFMANALVWRSQTRVEALTQQLRTGVHSPGRYRVLGPMTHSAAFAKAFGCKAGDAMVAADPIVIW